MWGAVFWPGGSPCWTGDCAPRRSLQPCCPAKHGGGMRGASAPPMSLLSSQDYCAYKSILAALIKRRGTTGHTAKSGVDVGWTVDFGERGSKWPGLHERWREREREISWHLGGSAPTCAPLMTAFSLRNMDLQQQKKHPGSCGDSKQRNRVLSREIGP